MLLRFYLAHKNRFRSEYFWTIDCTVTDKQ